MGDSEIAGVVIVKVADAVSGLPSLPVATTVYGPAASDGTVKVQEKAPAADVVWEVHVCVPGVTALKVKVLIAVVGVYPDPVTVIVIPFGPWVCERAMVGIVIVKVVEAVSLPPSLPVATTVYGPAASDGTVKVQEKVPVALVV